MAQKKISRSSYLSLFEKNFQRDIAEQAAAVVRRKEKEDKKIKENSLGRMLFKH